MTKLVAAAALATFGVVWVLVIMLVPILLDLAVRWFLGSVVIVWPGG